MRSQRLILATSCLLAGLSYGEEAGEKLDESFLLFLASMEKVDNEWLHAVDMQDTEVPSLKAAKKTNSSDDNAENMEATEK